MSFRWKAVKFERRQAGPGAGGGLGWGGVVTDGVEEPNPGGARAVREGSRTLLRCNTRASSSMAYGEGGRPRIPSAEGGRVEEGVKVFAKKTHNHVKCK